VGAKAACVHPDGDRTIDLELLYEPRPREGVLPDTTLRPGELIRAVVLEPTPLSRRSTYVEFRERLSFDFALVSVAAALHVEDGKVKEARIVCGAVAPAPYRARAAEQALLGKAPDPAAAAEAAVKGAAPLEHNKHKVVILKRLVRRALEELL
jgi:xanthine dehydrogenase YagS FAD-binding subunit